MLEDFLPIKKNKTPIELIILKLLYINLYLKNDQNIMNIKYLQKREDLQENKSNLDNKLSIYNSLIKQDLN